MAENSKRQCNLETSCWGLRPTTGHNGCLMMNDDELDCVLYTILQTVIHSHSFLQVHVYQSPVHKLCCLLQSLHSHPSPLCTFVVVIRHRILFLFLSNTGLCPPSSMWGCDVCLKFSPNDTRVDWLPADVESPCRIVVSYARYVRPDCVNLVSHNPCIYSFYRFISFDHCSVSDSDSDITGY